MPSPLFPLLPLLLPDGAARARRSAPLDRRGSLGLVVESRRLLQPLDRVSRAREARLVSLERQGNAVGNAMGFSPPRAGTPARPQCSERAVRRASYSRFRRLKRPFGQYG